MWLYHFQYISNLIQLFINTKLLTPTPPLCWFIVTLLVLGSSFFTHRHQGCVSCIALLPQSFCIQMWVSSFEAAYVAYVSFNDIYFTPFNYYFLNILDLHVYVFCKFVFAFVAILLFLHNFCFQLVLANFFCNLFFATMAILEFILTTILKFHS